MGLPPRPVTPHTVDTTNHAFKPGDMVAWLGDQWQVVRLMDDASLAIGRFVGGKGYEIRRPDLPNVIVGEGVLSPWEVELKVKQEDDSENQD